jgi:hypothetical protein
MSPTRFILVLFGSIVCLIISTAFVLSYANLVETAIEAGISPLLAPMWPVCLDAFLLAGSLFILRANLLGETPAPGWAVLLVFTGVSTAFNVYHSPENLVARAAHAVPPIALCVSLELLMMILKSDLTRETKAEEVEVEPSPNTIEPQKEPIEGGDVEKVRLYFEQNPGASVNKARQELKMSWKRVNEIKQSQFHQTQK